MPRPTRHPTITTVTLRRTGRVRSPTLLHLCHRYQSPFDLGQHVLGRGHQVLSFREPRFDFTHEIAPRCSLVRDDHLCLGFTLGEREVSCAQRVRARTRVAMKRYRLVVHLHGDGLALDPVACGVVGNAVDGVLPVRHSTVFHSASQP